MLGVLAAGLSLLISLPASATDLKWSQSAHGLDVNADELLAATHAEVEFDRSVALSAGDCKGEGGTPKTQIQFARCSPLKEGGFRCEILGRVDCYTKS